MLTSPDNIFLVDIGLVYMFISAVYMLTSPDNILLVGIGLV